jgi:hypothetical protein
VARIEAADVKFLSVPAIPSSFGTDPKIVWQGVRLWFAGDLMMVEAITSPVQRHSVRR